MFSGKHKQLVGDGTGGARQERGNSIELRPNNWPEILPANLIFGSAVLGEYTSDPIGRSDVNMSGPMNMHDAIAQFRVRTPRS
ncbi:hypothetical protein [Streptomyces sp. 11-1-2]|uniref:hypothetical protein n=1 Tax=unclassified Streptomyces TaxID=2593676 RepID=UPI0013C48A5F|nr:hypothetical protein [Streptomyces sp. 11-1-2]